MGPLMFHMIPHGLLAAPVGLTRMVVRGMCPRGLHLSCPIMASHELGSKVLPLPGLVGLS